MSTPAAEVASVTKTMEDLTVQEHKQTPFPVDPADKRENFTDYIPVDLGGGGRLFPQAGEDDTPELRARRREVLDAMRSMTMLVCPVAQLWSEAHRFALERDSQLRPALAVGTDTAHARREALIAGLTYVATHTVLQDVTDQARRTALANEIREVVHLCAADGVWPCATTQGPADAPGDSVPTFAVLRRARYVKGRRRTDTNWVQGVVGALKRVKALLHDALFIPFIVLVHSSNAAELEGRLMSIGVRRIAGVAPARDDRALFDPAPPLVFAAVHSAHEPDPLENAGAAFVRVWGVLYRAVNARGETVPQDVLLAGPADPLAASAEDRGVTLEFLLIHPNGTAPLGAWNTHACELPSTVVRANEDTMGAMRRLVQTLVPGATDPTVAQAEAIYRAQSGGDDLKTARADVDSKKRRGGAKRKTRQDQLERLRAAHPKSDLDPKFQFMHVTVSHGFTVPGATMVNLVYEISVPDADRTRLFECAAAAKAAALVYRVPMRAPYTTPALFRLAYEQLPDAVRAVDTATRGTHVLGIHQHLRSITAHTVGMVVTEIGRALNIRDAREAALRRALAGPTDTKKTGDKAEEDEDDADAPLRTFWMDVRRRGAGGGTGAVSGYEFEINVWHADARPEEAVAEDVVCLPPAVLVEGQCVPNLNRALAFWNSMRDATRGQWTVGNGAITLHFHRNMTDPRAKHVSDMPMAEIVTMMCPSSDPDVFREDTTAPSQAPAAAAAAATTAAAATAPDDTEARAAMSESDAKQEDTTAAAAAAATATATATVRPVTPLSPPGSYDYLPDAMLAGDDDDDETHND